MQRCPHHGQRPLPGTQKYCVHQRDGEDGGRSDRFGRMFGHLPPSFVPVDVLTAIGRHDGKMRGTDNAAARTKTVPVGFVFFGQFVDHDITLDVTSSFNSVVGSAGDIPNARTPQLDLDCVYGGGPEASPWLYDASATKLLVDGDDLQRNIDGVALIGDFRNDENRIISQLQLAMIKFHNARVDAIAAGPDAPTGHDLFVAARRDVTWHYQWCVVFDFLVQMCGEPVVHDVLCNGRKHYCGDEPYIPVEFSMAAYRFGHSMVPMKIQVQKNRPSFELFGTTFGTGFAPLGADVDAIVDWHELFDTSANRQVQRTFKLNTKLSPELLDLPVVDAPAQSPDRSLASRNLRRGNAFRLPAGEVVARHMGRDDTEIDKVMNRVRLVSDGAIDGCGAPLWLYLLAEAEEIGRAEPTGNPKKGEGLGPVGARIVAETIIGLLEMDDDSFLGRNRNWEPDAQFRSIGEILASTNSPNLP